MVAGFPGDEPPDDDRLVLVNITQDVRRMACYKHEMWHIFGLSGLALREVQYIDSWQELPPVKERE